MKNAPRLKITPALDDDKRVPAGGEELRTIQMLAMWASVLEYYEGTVTRRLKLIKNGFRDYKLLRHYVEHLISEIYKTLPNSTMARIIASANALEMQIKPRAAAHKDYFVLSSDAFLSLLQAVDDGACRMCLGDKETARRCPIRRILMDQIPPVEGTEHGLSDCPYSDGILSIAAKRAI